MKILIPSANNVDSFTCNVAFTLRAMGHEVRTGPERSWSWANRWWHRARLLQRNIQWRVFGGSGQVDDAGYLRMARSFRPDMVLALTNALSDEMLESLRRLGVKHRVAWWGDAPGNMVRRGLFSEGWDVVYLKDPEAVKSFRRVGIEAELMHEAMNPEWHRPVGAQRNDDIVVVGNAYFYRQMLVARLLRDGRSIGFYGSEPPSWSKPEILRAHSGRYVAGLDKSRVFHQGLCALNSMSLVERNALNCRAFEIAGAAGLQLIEQRPLIEACFEPGREVLVFDSYGQLADHIDRAKRAPQEVEAIRQAGHRRALAHHTYRHRLEAMLARFGATSR
jgi:spore maturation protein CgeB